MQSWDNISDLASKRIPFIFIIDYKADNVLTYTLDTLKDEDIEFSIDEMNKPVKEPINLEKFPIDFKIYKDKFDAVIEEIKNGNTYLLNLTQPTKIETKATLKEIFKNSHARFKLRYKNKFVSFSPEPFISISENKIHTYPMKGTIDASIKDAKNKILNNPKELAEHIMVVDLLRNDLGKVATNIKLEKFRYIESITTLNKTLLQVSSHISGKLTDNWRKNLGDILKNLLPAGSITGTPKKRTCEIIQSIEKYDRGFFSGVFGYFDGDSLKSGVLIRFIEKKDNQLIYKSGGGITIDSNLDDEYNEFINKIYIPILSEI